MAGDDDTTNGRWWSQLRQILRTLLSPVGHLYEAKFTRWPIHVLRSVQRNQRNGKVLAFQRLPWTSPAKLRFDISRRRGVKSRRNGGKCENVPFNFLSSVLHRYVLTDALLSRYSLKGKYFFVSCLMSTSLRKCFSIFRGAWNSKKTKCENISSNFTISKNFSIF